MDAQAIKDAVGSILWQSVPLDLKQPSVLARNLVFMWHTMRASEGLLELACSKSEGALREYYAQHLTEEHDHASWLANDLASVGIDVTKTAVPREAVELVGSQMYLITYLDPCVLLGYMVLMECFPYALDSVKELEAVHGADLIRTLRYHAENDIEHGGDVLAVIDELSERQRSLVFESATQSARYFVHASRSFA